MENKPDQKKLKTIINVIDKIVSVSIVVVVILLLILMGKFPWQRIENKGYKAYKYAKERVKHELMYPDTAKLPSFTKVSMKSDLVRSNRSHTLTNAWVISGWGTCENALRMTINFRFAVTVVVEKTGEVWCYECTVDF